MSEAIIYSFTLFYCDSYKYKEEECTSLILNPIYLKDHCKVRPWLTSIPFIFIDFVCILQILDIKGKNIEADKKKEKQKTIETVTGTVEFGKYVLNDDFLTGTTANIRAI